LKDEKDRHHNSATKELRKQTELAEGEVYKKAKTVKAHVEMLEKTLISRGIVTKVEEPEKILSLQDELSSLELALAEKSEALSTAHETGSGAVRSSHDAQARRWEQREAQHRELLSLESALELEERTSSHARSQAREIRFRTGNHQDLGVSNLVESATEAVCGGTGWEFDTTRSSRHSVYYTGGAGVDSMSFPDIKKANRVLLAAVRGFPEQTGRNLSERCTRYATPILPYSGKHAAAGGSYVFQGKAEDMYYDPAAVAAADEAEAKAAQGDKGADAAKATARAIPEVAGAEFIVIARGIFDDCDEDCEGTIDGEELNLLVKKMWKEMDKGSPSEDDIKAEVSSMLQQFDANGDDEISFEEFLEMLTVEPWSALLPKGGAPAIRATIQASKKMANPTKPVENETNKNELTPPPSKTAK